MSLSGGRRCSSQLSLAAKVGAVSSCSGSGWVGVRVRSGEAG